MIIGLTGNAGVGKDTVAEILVREYRFARIAFADALRGVLHELADVLLLPGSDSATLRWAVEGHGSLEKAKRADPRVRQLMTRVGNGMRGVLGQEVWVNSLRDTYNLYERDFVITDVSYQNEVDFLYEQPNSYLVRVERPGFDERRVPETLSAKPDGVIVNDGSIDDLRGGVRQMISDMVTHEACGMVL